LLTQKTRLLKERCSYKYRTKPVVQRGVILMFSHQLRTAGGSVVIALVGPAELYTWGCRGGLTGVLSGQVAKLPANDIRSLRTPGVLRLAAAADVICSLYNNHVETN